MVRARIHAIKTPLGRIAARASAGMLRPAPTGWQVAEQLGTAEFMARYVAPTGRALTVMPIERLVLAKKT